MLEVRELAYAYPRGPRPACDGLAFAVAGGEVLGLLGPAGAGKSTLVKILAGLIREYSGAVSFQGRELRAWGRDYFERIGVSFAFPGLFLKLTAAENLEYFGGLYSGRTLSGAALLERVGLARDADKRVRDFTPEMRNRLGVARALLHAPEALFLDEPAAGLGPDGVRRIKDLIASERGAGRAVLLLTRDAGLAEAVCDRVAFLVDGRILAQDRPDDLRLRHGKPEAGLEAAFLGLTGRRLS